MGLVFVLRNLKNASFISDLCVNLRYYIKESTTYK